MLWLFHPQGEYFYYLLRSGVKNLYFNRELCIQISEQFEALGAAISLKTVVIVGGLDPMAQAIALSKKPHISNFKNYITDSYSNKIVIGTPGRILYHLENTKGFHLKNMKYLV